MTSATHSSSPSIQSWLKAFRLRTLPLAFSTIAMGSFLAGAEAQFSWLVFILCFATTIFLQILSNLSNDYGDTVHGADNAERVGPQRTVQSGEISLLAMKKAMYVFGGLAFVTGVALIFTALRQLTSLYPIIFLLLGIGAITAAIKYTAGDNPYGYKGLGDIFVFIFFGLVGVGGTYFLHTQQFNYSILLPATAIGLFSTGVLNVNNMRDRFADVKAGKITLAVRLGESSKYYHALLILSGWSCALIFTFQNYHTAWQLLFLLVAPLHLLHLFKVLTNKEPALLDRQLKILAMSTLIFCIAFGAGLLLGR